MSIFVGNLPFRAEQEDIIELFSTYGEVTNCALPLERDTGRKRGFAFVEMSDEAAEASAIGALHVAELMGRPLRINKAEPRGSAPRRDFGGGGGGNYGGGGGGNYGGNYGGGGGGNYGGGGGERRSGASGWEDRSYGSGAPPGGGSAYDDGRTRRRGGGAGDNSGYGGAEG